MSQAQFAFVFPGQGSQSVGMLADLAGQFPSVGETFAEASAALGFDLWGLLRDGPEGELNRTEKTQPTMLSAGVAVWRVWRELGGADPPTMAGHSLGEYTALVCAGALDFADAVGLVAERGRLMQEAVPEGSGAMAAVLGLEDQRVRELCGQAAGTDVVEAVNFNAPGQVVVAGDSSAVERLIDLAKAAGAKRALPLPVSVPSHCALMQPAAEKLGRRLADTEVRPPGIRVLHNVSASASSDPDEIRRLLTRQLHSPVRWTETVRAMVAAGASSIVECGPGKVLTGLGKRIDRSVSGFAMFDPESVKKTLETLTNAAE